jgi:BASS family bile acid:Na+ symporter
LLGYTGYLAVGLILICSAPGGTMSNAFVMYAHGDTALSVVMTLVSSLVAFVMWPALTGFYGGLLPDDEQDDLVIPQLEMMLTIALGALRRGRCWHSASPGSAHTGKAYG